MEINPADTRKTLYFNKNRDPLMSLAKSIKLQPSHQVDLQVQMHIGQSSKDKKNN